MQKKIIPYDQVENFKNIKAQAERNSKDWYNADDKTKQGLNNANQMLYRQMDNMTGGKSSYNAATGQWNTAYDDGNGNWGNDSVPSAKTYTPMYQDKIDDLYSDINGSQFSYDPTSDPSYRAYQAMYQREGDRASQSTLADVATAQGGVSSYAGTAAQQASNYYAQQLTDKIPQLEQLAYEKYNADLNNKYNMINMYQNQDNMGYNRFIDDRNYQYQTDRDKLSDDRYNNELVLSNQRYDDETAYGREQDSKKWDYQDKQLGLSQYATMHDINSSDTMNAYSIYGDWTNRGRMPPPNILKALNIPKEDAQKYINQVNAEKALQAAGSIDGGSASGLAQFLTNYNLGIGSGYDTSTHSAVKDSVQPVQTLAPQTSTQPANTAIINSSEAETDEDLKKNSLNNETQSYLTDDENALIEKYRLDESDTLPYDFDFSQFDYNEYQQAREVKEKANTLAKKEAHAAAAQNSAVDDSGYDWHPSNNGWSVALGVDGKWKAMKRPDGTIVYKNGTKEATDANDKLPFFYKAVGSAPRATEPQESTSRADTTAQYRQYGQLRTPAYEEQLAAEKQAAAAAEYQKTTKKRSGSSGGSQPTNKKSGSSGGSQPTNKKFSEMSMDEHINEIYRLNEIGSMPDGEARMRLAALEVYGQGKKR